MTTADILGITGPQALWKLQYGLPGESGIHEVEPATLATFSLDPWFVATPDGFIQMRVEVNAGHTSGSTYPRVELRELKPDGSEAAWDNSTGHHYLDFEVRVDHLPPHKPQASLAQTHDGSSDIIEVLATGEKLTWRVNGSASGQKQLPLPVVGTPCRLEWIDGTTNLYVGDLTKPALTTTKAKKSKAAYFKAGMYLQSNTKDDAATEYGQASFRNVAVYHPGFVEPAPTPVPAPAPVPAPTPTPAPAPDPGPVDPRPHSIMIIRHGEKPTPEGHDLSAVGQQRAQDLVGLFTNPPAGLFRPTKLYASKGATASNRPVETLQPLATALGLSIDSSFDKSQAAELSAELPTMAAQDVLICWEHGELPGLLAHLGTTVPAAPTSWPDDRYDVVWVLTPNGPNWTFNQIPENVMPGDQNTGTDGSTPPAPVPAPEPVPAPAPLPDPLPPVVPPVGPVPTPGPVLPLPPVPPVLPVASGGGLSGLLDGLTHGVESAVGAVEGAVKSAGSGVASVAGGVVGAVEGAAKSIAGVASDVVKNVVPSATGAVGAVVTGIEEGVSTAVSAPVAPTQSALDSEPVAVGHAVTVLLSALVTLGWVNLPNSVISWVGSAIAFVVSLLVMLQSRSKVTPVGGSFVNELKTYVGELVAYEVAKIFPKV